jgi:hypothetical protein
MTIERRSHPRTNLHVPLFLLPPESSVPIQTETENIGIDGLFCYIKYLFSPGTSIKFLLVLPPAATQPQSVAGICVHGEAEITRVSVGPAQSIYGVGARLSTYRVLPDSDSLALDEIVATILQTKLPVGQRQKGGNLACKLVHFL